MESALLELAVVVAAAWLVWRLIAQRLKPADPGDYAGVGARLRPRPRLGAGAVALAEPDEDEEEPPRADSVPRRGIR